MPDKVPASLLVLPVKLVYRILNNLDDLTMCCLARNICQRLNVIMDIYQRYQ
ncbi:unnamed protein product, partial [Rotaria sp. Silwood2]